MALATQTDMFHIVLELMQDGKERSRQQTNAEVKELLQLTPEEAGYKTSSGKAVYESRVGWSISYLSRAKLVDRISRGVYRVNDDGRALYETGIDGSALFQKLQKIISEKNPWGTASDDEPAPTSDSPQAQKSPQEQIADLADEMNASLGDEILALIMDCPPAFFEKVVVDLMERMGYGKGVVTRYTNDGGIDGLITTDELGFRPIYTQAKRYSADHKVGRDAVQSFVGALNGSQNGVFITTSSFTDGAIEYAKGYPNATLSLIDGKRLASLMIKYGLGVATESVVEIKRVDSDYFAEE